jgi:hypothetical protein
MAILVGAPTVVAQVLGVLVNLAAAAAVLAGRLVQVVVMVAGPVERLLRTLPVQVELSTLVLLIHYL